MKLRNMVEKAAGASSGLLLATLVNFFLSAMLSTMLLPQEYGAVVVALTTALIGSQFAQLGFLRAGTKIVAQALADNDLAGLKSFLIFSFAAVSIVSLFAALVITYLFDSFADADSHLPSAGLLAGLLIWPFAISRLVSGIFIGEQKPFFGAFFQSGLPNMGILLSVALLAFFVGTGWTSSITSIVVLGAYAATFLGLIFFFVGVVDTRKVKSSPFQPMLWLSISLPLMLVGAIQITNRQVGVLIIGAVADAEAVAEFYPAFRISELATIGLIAVNAALAPLIAKAFGRGDKAALQSIMSKAALISLASTVFFVVGIVVFQDLLFSLFAGVAYEGRTVLLILLIGQVVNAATGSVSVLMAMAGEQNFAALVAAIVLCLNFAILPFLVFYFDVEGAAAAIAFTSVIWNIVLLVRANRKFGVNTTIFSRKLLRIK